MVEELKSTSASTTKYCKRDHIEKIKFHCDKEDTFICDDCAIEHSEHFEQLEPLKFIFQKKLPQYSSLLEKLRLATLLEVNEDEIRSFIYQQLENSYDKFIAHVIDYKTTWIQTQFQEILGRGNVVVMENNQTVNLSELSKQTEEIITKIKSYISTDSMNVEGLIGMKKAEIMSEEMNKIVQISNKRREILEI